MLKSIFKKASIWVWETFKIKKKPKQILIMSHMRSGSSLLMHLLSSNDEILGWGERNFTYTNSKSITEIELNMRWHSKKIFKSFKYIVDQINHNRHTPNPNLFNHSNIYIIFLIREPENSISSMLKLHEQFYEKYKGKIEINELIEYYTERIEYQSNFIDKTPHSNHLFITYELLTQNSDKTLKSISKFLNLKKPLSQNYEVKKYTGKSGDPSSNIKSGKILKSKKHSINITDFGRKKLQKSYAETVKKFNNKIVSL